MLSKKLTLALAYFLAAGVVTGGGFLLVKNPKIESLFASIIQPISSEQSLAVLTSPSPSPTVSPIATPAPNVAPQTITKEIIKETIRFIQITPEPTTQQEVTQAIETVTQSGYATLSDLNSLENKLKTLISSSQSSAQGYTNQVIYNFSSAQKIDNLNNIAIINGLTISSGRLTVTEDISIGGGAFTVDSSGNINTSGTLVVGSSTFSANNSTTTFGGPIASLTGNFIVASAGITSNLLLNPYGGSVGIASTSPWGLLSINPNGISGPSFAIGSSTTTNFVVANNGNVGVGTSTPSAKLSVAGDLLVLGQNGTFVWNSALSQLNVPFIKTNVDAWTTLASVPGTAVWNGSPRLVYTGGDYIYSGGGIDGSKEFWRYSISNNAWTQMADAPDTFSNYATPVYTGGDYIYVPRGQDYRTLWRYSISGNSWDSLADAPFALNLGSHAAYTGGDYIYFRQGYYSSTFRYSISTNTWADYTTIAFTPTGERWSEIVYTGGDYLYALDGNDNTIFYRYSFSANSWTTMASAPGNVKGGSSLIYGGGNYIYAFQGNGTNSFWRYSITTNSWTVMTAAPGVVNYGGSLVYANGYIYGRSGNGATNFWRYSIGDEVKGFSTLANSGLMLRGNITTDGGGLGIMSGNVGIGTTSPWGFLSVNASGITSGAPQFVIGSSTRTDLIVTQNGNVGIGTTAPGVQTADGRRYLTISGSTGQGILELITQQADADNVQVGQIAWVDKNSIASDKRTGVILSSLSGTTANDRGGILAFYTKSEGGNISEKMRISNTGNVGNGTTTPLSQFSVVSSGNAVPSVVVAGYSASQTADLFQARQYPTATPSFVIDYGGRVGIGTTSPYSLLSISNSAATPVNTPLFTIASTTAGTATSTLLTVLASGNVGIGTTSPSQLLEVRKDQNALTGLLVDNPIAGNQAAAMVKVSGSSSFIEIGAIGDGANTRYGQGATETYVASNSQTLALVADYAGGRIKFATGGQTERMRLSATGGLSLGASYATTDPGAGNMIISGNVGIGTTSPWGKLAVNQFNGGLAPLFVIASSTGSSATSTLFLINSNGNVGIGTTNPGAKLEVTGSIWQEASAGVGNYLRTNKGNLADSASLNPGILVFGGGTDNSNYGMDLGYSGDYRTRIFAATNKDISFATVGTNPTLHSNFTELMVIKGATGNVGIGTTTPGANLEVVGAGSDAPIFITAYKNDAFTPVPGIVGRGARGPSTAPTALLADDNLMFISGRGYGATEFSSGSRGAIAIKASQTWTDANQGTYLTLSTTDNNTITLDERVRITNDGNVGIGTTSPTAKLHIAGNAKSDTSLQVTVDRYAGTYDGVTLRHNLYRDDTGAVSYGPAIYDMYNGGSLNTVRIHSSGSTYFNGGNVGIGTTTPGAKLQVSSTVTESDNEIISLQNAQSWNLAPGKFQQLTWRDGTSIAGALGMVYNQSSDMVDFTVNSLYNGGYKGTSTIAFIVKGSGNIGIGTTTPSRILDIDSAKGNAIAAGWDVWSSKEYKKEITYLNNQDYSDILDEIAETNVATYYYRGEASCSTEDTLNPSQPPFTEREGPLCKKRLGLIAEEAPRAVLSATGDSISLYDLASYTLAGVKALSLKVDDLNVRLKELESKSFSSSLTILGGDSSSILASISLAIEDGLLRFKSLTSRTIVIEKTADPKNDSIGEGVIKAGETEIRIESTQIKASSKIFVTFRNDYESRWWVNDQGDGFFVVKIVQPLSGDIKFDWWVIGVAEPFVENLNLDLSSPPTSSEPAQDESEPAASPAPVESPVASESPTPTPDISPAVSPEATPAAEDAPLVDPTE